MSATVTLLFLGATSTGPSRGLTQVFTMDQLEGTGFEAPEETVGEAWKGIRERLQSVERCSSTAQTVPPRAQRNSAKCTVGMRYLRVCRRPSTGQLTSRPRLERGPRQV